MISDFQHGRFPLKQLKQTYTWYQMQSRYRLMIGLHGSLEKDTKTLTNMYTH